MLAQSTLINLDNFSSGWSDITQLLHVDAKESIKVGAFRVMVAHFIDGVVLEN